jgi:hypothetical protein
VVKIKGQEFYAFLSPGPASIAEIETHVSYHRSGKRHMVAKRLVGEEWREDRWLYHGHGSAKTMRQQTATALQPPATLRGAEQLFHCGTLYGTFHKLAPVGTNAGELVILDAESAGFRDDFTITRAFLVQPGREDAVPIAADTGPRIIHFVKRITPWVAVDVFQQKVPPAT